MEQKFCQSCGMPMESKEIYGTNADGSLNDEYCAYCWKDGKFTADVSMSEMIEFCVPHMAAAHPEISPDDARRMMQDFFPTLKRWK